MHSPLAWGMTNLKWFEPRFGIQEVQVCLIFERWNADLFLTGYNEKE
jgi:hypothetical protein